MLNLLYRFLPANPAYAHCDVPCGIYSVEPAKLAARTCLKMIQKINELPGDGTDAEMIAAHNTFVRCVVTKEEHARICKQELYTLWSDYFKPEHLTQFPTLHDSFWQAAKLCSQVKQTVDEAKAQELIKAVDQIGQIFDQSQAPASH